MRECVYKQYLENDKAFQRKEMDDMMTAAGTEMKRSTKVEDRYQFRKKKKSILNLQLQQRRVGLPTESSQPAIGSGNIILQEAKSSVGFSNGHWRNFG